MWTIDELLAETTAIEPTAARNIVQLFENENTIPFICRYRRDLINHLEPERLREIKSTYTEIVNLRKKAETIVSQLTKENTINEEIRTEMLCAKTPEELEFLVNLSFNGSSLQIIMKISRYNSLLLINRLAKVPWRKELKL